MQINENNDDNVIDMLSSNHHLLRPAILQQKTFRALFKCKILNSPVSMKEVWAVIDRAWFD